MWGCLYLALPARLRGVLPWGIESLRATLKWLASAVGIKRCWGTKKREGNGKGERS